MKFLDVPLFRHTTENCHHAVYIKTRSSAADSQTLFSAKLQFVLTRIEDYLYQGIFHEIRRNR